LPIQVSKASLHGADEHLWACLRIAVDQRGRAIGLDAPDPDKGRAVVIGKVGKEGGAWHPAALANPDALRLAEYLRVYRFPAGEDGDSEAPGTTLRLGPPHTALNPTPGDHAQHLWVSLPPGAGCSVKRWGAPKAAGGPRCCRGRAARRRRRSCSG
jgi:hypothetical protein